MTLQEFRARFPILQKRVYVNSCSQGALSVNVEEALAAFVQSWHDHGSPWDRWVDDVERLRTEFASLENPFAFRLDPLDWPCSARRFEAGTPPVPNAVAAAAGIALLQRLGLNQVDALDALDEEAALLVKP